MKSDGSTASYYELPEGASQLQDLISHSDKMRDAKKMKFYAEIARLEKLK